MELEQNRENTVRCAQVEIISKLVLLSLELAPLLPSLLDNVGKASNSTQRAERQRDSRNWGSKFQQQHKNRGINYLFCSKVELISAGRGAKDDEK